MESDSLELELLDRASRSEECSDVLQQIIDRDGIVHMPPGVYFVKAGWWRSKRKIGGAWTEK